jgi:hypothetical protein
MTKLSKSDAAKCIGVFRSTLYDYIKQGKLNTDPDGKIDTTELLKRGFTLQTPDMSEDVRTTQTRTPDTDSPEHVAYLVRLVDRLEEEGNIP